MSATEQASPQGGADAWSDPTRATQPDAASRKTPGWVSRPLSWLTSARRWLMPLLSIVIFIAVLRVLQRELAGTSLSDVWVYLSQQPVGGLLLALLFTSTSYACRALYDVIGVHLTRKTVPAVRNVGIAFLANAIGQNIGFVVLTAGAIRYRLYSTLGLTATDVGIVLFTATLTALLGLASFAGVSLLAMPADLPLSATALDLWRIAGLALLLAVMGYLFWAICSRRAFTSRYWSWRPPGARIAWAQAGSSCADYVLAAAALWVLLPESAPISLAAFCAAFSLAALGGSIAGVPGGVGVFESVFLVTLPGIPPAELVGALILYRAIFYLLPLFIASGALAWQELRARTSGVRRVSAAVSEAP